MDQIKKALKLLFIWNVLIRGFAIFGYSLLPSRFAPLDFIAPFLKDNFLFWSWANFDGEHYLSIAKFGYQVRSGFPQFAFFPLLPLLIKLVSVVFRDYFVSGIIVSQLSLFLALIFLQKWATLRRLPDMSLPFLFSTGTVFLASIYTEPLFLALALMTFVFAEQKHFGKAALTAALATATRVNGVFLVAFLVVKLLQNRTSLFISSFFALLSASGIFSYMLYLFYKTGDSLAWYHSQSSWGKSTLTSPLTTLGSYFHAITDQFIPDLTHLVVLVEVATTLFAFVLGWKLLQRRALDLAYWVYLGGSLALPLATGSLGSMPRFFLPLFPLLVVLPHLPKPLYYLYTIFSVGSAALGIILFTRGYWYG